MKQKKKLFNQTSFIYLELILVAVFILILLGIIIVAHNGVSQKNRNNFRRTSIDNLQKDLEQYYADNNVYPTLSNLNNSNWMSSMMPYLDQSILVDPSSNNSFITAVPKINHISYSVKSLTGSACDNKQVKCSAYMLTVKLEGGGKYTKSSLN